MSEPQAAFLLNVILVIETVFSQYVALMFCGNDISMSLFKNIFLLVLILTAVEDTFR